MYTHVDGNEHVYRYGESGGEETMDCVDWMPTMLYDLHRVSTTFGHEIRDIDRQYVSIVLPHSFVS